MGIYQIHNEISEKNYIGASINVENRLVTHKRNLEKGNHKNEPMQQDFNKEGKHFSFHLLEEVNSKKRIKEREQYFIDLFESHDPKFGYNRSSTSGYSPDRKQGFKKVSNYVYFEAMETMRDKNSDLIFKNSRLRDEVRELRKEKAHWKREYNNLLLEINSNPYVREAVEKHRRDQVEKMRKVFGNMYEEG